ncbi:LysE family translocator [Pseudahrensia aquimaris]|uniref:LysE family translocator n=1 Tax=Pseudahrensia aquimaris TaxID=744461 RepID=A0ABW3FBQ9_9HYPH
MLTFLSALLLILGTPGPGVLSLAGVGSAFGYGPGWRYGFGLFVGSNMVMLAAALGLAALFVTNESFRLVFTVLSTAYLCYLAAKIAFAGSKIAFIEATTPPGFWGAIALQVINPKAYAVGTFVFSNFPIWPESLLTEIIIKFVLLNAVWIPIHIIWLAAGVSLNSLDLAPKTQRVINIAMALAMMAVVGLAMWTNFYR